MPENKSENIPDEWVGKNATIQYKALAYGDPGQPWSVAVVSCVIEEKNDLGLVVRERRQPPLPPDQTSKMLLAYDALLTVDVSL